MCVLAEERPLSLPLRCPCLNGGACDSNGECVCLEGYTGTDCETYVEINPVAPPSSPNTEAIAVPIVVILIVAFAVALYIFFRKQNL